MNFRKTLAAVLGIVLLVGSTGCTDAIIRGVTGGIEDGLGAVVSGFIETLAPEGE